ncbi:MAG: hypothetical protein V4695_07575 [Pseudomonadota bacterium]
MKSSSSVKKFFSLLHEPGASSLLLMVVIADFLFVALHLLLFKTTLLSNPLLNIEMDKGYAELFQYLKYLWIILLLSSVCLKEKAVCYVPWVVLFAYFLLDDALGLHESAGYQIGTFLSFTPPFGLRPDDIGEFLVSVSAGLIILPLIVVAYLRSTRAFRKFSHDLILLVMVLVFFGVAVDMVHMALHDHATIAFYLGVLEDGGEMLSLSLILWYAFLVLMRTQKARVYLSDLISMPFSTRASAHVSA